MTRTALAAGLLGALVASAPVPSTAAGNTVTTVAQPVQGSSDPTWFASNRRVAVTKAGRVLVVHGLHATGVQLKWRDPGERWKKKTRGKVSDGVLLKNTGTGDWTASIATATDGEGVEHAWVVWSGWSATNPQPLQMRRLTGLKSPDGPKVGPTVTLEERESSLVGPSKVDLAFEKKPDGKYRGVLTWQRRMGETSFDLVASWFTQLGTSRPSLSGESVLFSGTSYSRVGTLAPTPDGMALVAKGPDTRLRLWRHDASDPLRTWTEAPPGVSLSSNSYPAAVGLDNGDVLAAVESNTTTHTVTVQRWSGLEEPTISLVPVGEYEKPTITTNGDSAWLVMVRTLDGHVVSREMDGGLWGVDVSEIGDEAGGEAEWPNAPRTTNGKLRFLVRGPRYDADQTGVLFFQRNL